MLDVVKYLKTLLIGEKLIGLGVIYECYFRKDLFCHRSYIIAKLINAFSIPPESPTINQRALAVGWRSLGNALRVVGIPREHVEKTRRAIKIRRKEVFFSVPLTATTDVQPLDTTGDGARNVQKQIG